MAFQRIWFWAYDITAAVMCALGVVVALSLVRPSEERLPRQVLGFLAWCGTGLLVLRGGAGAVKIVYVAFIAGRDVINRAVLWDVWFLLGAILFSLAIRMSRRINPS